MDQNGRQTEKPFVNTTDNNDDWWFFFFFYIYDDIMCKGAVQRLNHLLYKKSSILCRLV